MLKDDDLEAAIGEGIVTQAQADALRALAGARRAGSAAARADDERFVFMRGFNDFFFALGVLLVGGALWMFARVSGFGLAYAAAAILMWALAELLVRRMRLVLPGMMLVILFAAFAATALPAPVFDHVYPSIQSSWDRLGFLSFVTRSGTLQVALKMGVGAIAALLFYLRFRLPFALFVAGACLVIALTLGIGHLAFNDASKPRVAIMFIGGIATFAAAMQFDLSDRLRVTRRTDCAFWLHVLAAPLLVHSLVRLVNPTLFSPDLASAIIVVLIAVVLTLIALIIDRRALVVSALAYIGAIVAYALGRTGADAVTSGISTLLILGLFVLAIGIGWAPLRRMILSPLSSRFVDRLPPVSPT